MLKFFALSEDATVLARFVSAVLLVIWTFATFAVVVALMWRDWNVVSFFDRWFASWSDLQMTLLASAMFLIAFFWVKAAQRSVRGARHRNEP